jgi:hypothetical protein
MGSDRWQLSDKIMVLYIEILFNILYVCFIYLIFYVIHKLVQGKTLILLCKISAARSCCMNSELNVRLFIAVGC